MSSFMMSRRSLIARLSGTAAALIVARPVIARVAAEDAATVRLTDGTLTLEFDAGLYSRISRGDTVLTAMEPGEAIRIGDQAVDRFLLLDQTQETVSGLHGPGRVHHLRGTAGGRIVTCANALAISAAAGAIRRQ